MDLPRSPFAASSSAASCWSGSASLPWPACPRPSAGCRGRQLPPRARARGRLPARAAADRGRLVADARSCAGVRPREAGGPGHLARPRTPLAALTTLDVALKKAARPRSTARCWRNAGSAATDVAPGRTAAGAGPARRRRRSLCTRGHRPQRTAPARADLVRPLAGPGRLTLRTHAAESLPSRPTPASCTRCSPTCCTTPSSTTGRKARIDLTAERGRQRLHAGGARHRHRHRPEACGQIFERFYRADPSRARRRAALPGWAWPSSRATSS